MFHFRAFDVEMLYIAEKLNMSLAEVAVNWTEVEGNIVYFNEVKCNP